MYDKRVFFYRSFMCEKHLKYVCLLLCKEKVCLVEDESFFYIYKVLFYFIYMYSVCVLVEYLGIVFLYLRWAHGCVYLSLNI